MGLKDKTLFLNFIFQWIERCGLDTSDSILYRDATIPIRVNSNSRIGRNWLELELELVGIGRNWNWNWSELVGIGRNWSGIGIELALNQSRIG